MIKHVGKYESCMVSKLPSIWKQTVDTAYVSSVMRASELPNKGGFLRIFLVARLSMSLSTDRPGVGGELPEKDLCLVVVQCFDGFQQLHLQHHTNDDRSIHAYLLNLRVRGHIIGHARNNM